MRRSWANRRRLPTALSRTPQAWNFIAPRHRLFLRVSGLDEVAHCLGGMRGARSGTKAGRIPSLLHATDARTHAIGRHGIPTRVDMRWDGVESKRPWRRTTGRCTVSSRVRAWAQSDVHRRGSGEVVYIFVGSTTVVFVAASIVAFGPALVLDYVPARKVDVYDKADAASAAGKTQRLLLAFAGGGLMAEAALHLLPHLFAPHHGHGHGHEGEHHDEQGFVDTFMLIAAGFLATFAIDRFGGRKADDFSPRHGGVHVSKGVDVKAPVAAASDVAEATTAETKEVKAGVEDTTEPAAAEHPSPQEKQDEAPEMTTVAKSDEVPEEAPGTSSKEAEPTTPAADTPTEVPEVVEDTTQSATDALAKNLPAADAVATDAPDAELPADDPQEIEASVTEPTAADAQETKPPASEPSASDPPASDPPASDPPATDTPAADTPAMVPPATDSPAETTDAKADGIDVGVITKGAEGDEPDMDAAPATEADPPTPATEATEEGTPDATKPEGGAGDDGIEDADADAAALPKADPDPAEPELTLYGNPKTPLEAEAPAAEAKTTEERTEDTAARELKDDVPKEDEKKMERAEADGAGHHGGDGDDHHHDDHGEAGGGAYATLAVDVLHNMIDGFGIGTAYVFQGTSAGHMTALLKLIHELQHEVGDVATLVQHGMSKHHAIHVQHTTAAGVFLGLAISLTAGAFPSGLLSVLLALSAGATFQLASGTILGPVLAIPAGVGGARHAFLELLAMTAGAGGVVAIGAAEKMVGLGH